MAMTSETVRIERGCMAFEDVARMPQRGFSSFDKGRTFYVYTRPVKKVDDTNAVAKASPVTAESVNTGCCRDGVLPWHRG